VYGYEMPDENNEASKRDDENNEASKRDGWGKRVGRQLSEQSKKAAAWAREQRDGLGLKRDDPHYVGFGEFWKDGHTHLMSPKKIIEEVNKGNFEERYCPPKRLDYTKAGPAIPASEYVDEARRPDQGPSRSAPGSSPVTQDTLARRAEIQQGKQAERDEKGKAEPDLEAQR
jgi:hypothetical protein